MSKVKKKRNKTYQGKDAAVGIGVLVAVVVIVLVIELIRVITGSFT
jgi:hypothetical protein